MADWLAYGSALIDQMPEEYSVVELCQALAVSSSGNYQWRAAKVGARQRHNQQPGLPFIRSLFKKHFQNQNHNLKIR